MATITIEHTDTFGGEANYSWVRREVLDAQHFGSESNLALVRRAKQFAGITGRKAKVTNCGDMIEIRPAGLCQVVFITWDY